MLDKRVCRAEALATYFRGDQTLLVGGFGLCGIPEALIDLVVSLPHAGYTVVSNNCGVDGFGLGRLLEADKIRRIIASYVGENRGFEARALAGELEVSLTPQGTLAEALRAGGSGIPAFYTATGVGTPHADGKETRRFGTRDYLLEEAIRGDVALVKAAKADRAGNLCFRRTARNMNPLCAMAAAVTLVEADHILAEGELDPDEIHLPGIFVTAVIQSHAEKRIERRRLREPAPC